MKSEASSRKPLAPAVFLDRDGVLNHDSSYVFRIADLKVLDGVTDALVMLQKAGFRLIVISNQSGVARGKFTTDDVERFNAALSGRLSFEGRELISAFYYCPYLPDAEVAAYRKDSPDRKPGTGMIEKACADHGIDRKGSWLVGDRASDVDCAIAAGMRSVQVTGDTSYPRHAGADACFENLLEAAKFICKAK